MSLSTSTDADAPRMTPVVRALIALNVVVLFVQVTAVWSAADIAATFGFQWTQLAGRWWSVVTYMFVHGGLLHLATNMVTLLIFGPRIEHAWGGGRFLRFYLGCGLAGLLVHALFVRDGAMLIGASGAVFGVMVAYAATWPTDEVLLFGIIPLRVWSLVWLLIGVNLMMGIGTSFGGSANVAYFAHVGGALAAWFYMRTPAGTGLDTMRHRVSTVPDVDELPRAIPRSQPRPRERMDEVDEIVARSRAIAARRPATPASDRPRQPSGVANDEVDRVLDKISAEGLDSLTEHEREILELRATRLKNPES